MNLVEEIKSLFERVPNDFEKIEKLLSSRELTKEELAEIAISAVDNCFCEYQTACNPEYKDFNVEDMHSNSIVDGIRLLIKFGLDPNVIIDDDSVMWNTMYIDAPGIAASVLKLLLENGGNPNHYMPSEKETIFDYIDFKVSYDEYTHEFFHTVQYWWLLMAYGACWQNNGKIPITMLGNNSVEIFKNYELYDYEIEPLPQEPGKYGCWIMHIYNIETKEEVAVYK